MAKTVLYCKEKLLSSTIQLVHDARLGNVKSGQAQFAGVRIKIKRKITLLSVGRAHGVETKCLLNTRRTSDLTFTYTPGV